MEWLKGALEIDPPDAASSSMLYATEGRTSPGIKGVKPRARINQIGRVPIDWEGSCSTPLSRCES